MLKGTLSPGDSRSSCAKPHGWFGSLAIPLMVIWWGSVSIHPNGLLRRPEVILKLTWVGGMAIQILALVPLYDTCVHIYMSIHFCTIVHYTYCFLYTYWFLLYQCLKFSLHVGRGTAWPSTSAMMFPAGVGNHWPVDLAWSTHVIWLRSQYPPRMYVIYDICDYRIISHCVYIYDICYPMLSPDFYVNLTLISLSSLYRICPTTVRISSRSSMLMVLTLASDVCWSRWHKIFC
jgi:hypothetical protein